MPTRNINLTPEMDKFVARRIREGRYANASEVLRAGLRALEQEEKEDRARIDALRQALQAGDESGIAEGDVFEQVRDYIKQLEAARKRNRYQQARKRATARLRKSSDLHTTLTSRDELHERRG